MRELPRGTVTLLFTDIEGSTRLLHELGDAYAEVLATHRRVLRDAFGRHGGVEVDMQRDAFFYAFARAADAVEAAAAAQAALAAGPVRVRIGVHTGEPLVTDEGYVGADVHRAARIMSAGHGGQVLVSETTRRLVDSRFTLRDLGPQRLKDMTEAHHLFQAGEGDFPPLKTLNQTNLPIAASALLGREAELAELVDLLVNGVHVVTVTGAGGSGKTRLALQAAADVTDRFADGVFWIPLAGIGDPELVLPSVAQALGVKGDLATHVGSRQMLLLLDNFEHVLRAAPQLAEVVATAPDLRVLVTSRSALHIDGEHEYTLDPLTDDAAVTLFVERARSAGANVAADETVAEICRRLDRLPLALELAAARAKLVTPRTLLERLERRLPLLTGGRRDAPERQRTLRATIEWSFDLLDDDAKRLFEGLSVFAGSFSLEAAERVAEADLDALSALVDLNLLKPTGDDRFLMLETIREFAGERLAQSPDPVAVHDAHSRFVLDLARRAAAEPRGREGSRLLDELAQEQDNLRAGLTWLRESGRSSEQLEVVAGVWRFWFIKGAFAEGLRWAEEGLKSAGDEGTVLRAKVLNAAGAFASSRGHGEMARDYGEKSLAILREQGTADDIASVLNNLGAHASEVEDLDLAARRFEQALQVRGISATVRALIAFNLATRLALPRGDYSTALALLGEVLELERELDSDIGVGRALANRALCLFHLRRDEEALADLAEGIRRSAAVADVIDLVREFVVLGAISSRRSHPEPAAVFVGFVDSLRDRSALDFERRIEDLYRRTAETARRALGEDEYARHHARGKQMSLGEALEDALAFVD